MCFNQIHSLSQGSSCFVAGSWAHLLKLLSSTKYKLWRSSPNSLATTCSVHTPATTQRHTQLRIHRRKLHEAWLGEEGELTNLLSRQHSGDDYEGQSSESEHQEIGLLLSSNMGDFYLMGWAHKGVKKLDKCILKNKLKAH